MGAPGISTRKAGGVSGDALPAWALQRVASVVEKEKELGRRIPAVAVVTRRSGLNKRLVRRCLVALNASRTHSHAPPTAHSSEPTMR